MLDESIISKLRKLHSVTDEQSASITYEESVYPFLFTGLQGDYRLGQESTEIGTNALKDYSDNANHGAYRDSRLFPEVWRRCADFTLSATAKVNIPDHADIQNIFAAGGTCGAWIRIDDITESSLHYIQSKGAGNDGGWGFFTADTSGLRQS